MSSLMFYTINLETHEIQKQTALQQIESNQLMIVLKKIRGEINTPFSFVNSFYNSAMVVPQHVSYRANGNCIKSDYIYSYVITPSGEDGLHMWVIYHLDVKLLTKFQPYLINDLLFRDYRDTWHKLGYDYIHCRYFCLIPR